MIVNCPVCGRPAKVQPQFIDEELACAHCCGHFVVEESSHGWMAVKSDSTSGYERQLRVDNQRFSTPTATQPEREPSPECQPVTFVVEHRDEIFARIATDVAEAGYRVIRAKSTIDALKACGHFEPTLVVASANLPDQNGWLLACKLALVDSNVRIWLYDSHATDYDQSIARYLHVETLIRYDGDLLGLSHMIVERLNEHAVGFQDAVVATATMRRTGGCDSGVDGSGFARHRPIPVNYSMRDRATA
ncbi:response regulator [Novipirellula artificiosorum]|nr:response regulator [Novipirellula artificiosorum]